MRKLSSGQIRQMFLDFFMEKGHMVEKGHSLIPNNDPTLLWINSGVAALKKYFDGTQRPLSNRITNAQKAIRSNDIENVGKTARHHTFFEMLGNFSIGDYFKEEAITFAWEFMTSEKWMGLDKDRLYISVHTSDQVAYDIWHNKMGVAADHIGKFEGNFWEIGEGPCGPNSEIFYDRGPQFDPENKGVSLFFNDEENDRYVEVWNIVFSQYNAKDGVKREDYLELPQKNIDTGMGFERLVCILQEGETNYDTDLFLPIIEATQTLTSKKYVDNKIPYRVIADHIRTVVFALGDGALFSNEGRGYVLRRIIRRAIRYGRKLGINKPFMYNLVEIVANVMESYYPELKSKVELISKLVFNEEQRFALTLMEGEKLLQSILSSSQNKIVSGADAFKLYDTYGFPLELTVEIALESGFSVDEDGFKEHMAQQKENSRNAREEIESFSSQQAALMDLVTDFEFLGYELDKCQAKVVALFKNGELVDELVDEGLVVFDRTVFYATSGGQVADKGIIFNDKCQASVIDVTKAPHKQHLHQVNITMGQIKVGDEFSLVIDNYARKLTARNHSSLHLLHSALRQVLGDHIKQAGSYVDNEYGRFDFTHYQKVTSEELGQIQSLVNQWIVDGFSVNTELMAIEEAKKTGAMALFDEKYGDVVRVVTMGEPSKELCGGTHVKNTSEIGLYQIISEESVGSGVRRISGVTSLKAYQLMSEYKDILNQTATILNVNHRDKLIHCVENTLKKVNDLEQQIKVYEKSSLQEKVSNLAWQSVGDKNYVVFKMNLDVSLVRELFDLIKNYKSKVFAFGICSSQDKAVMMAISHQDWISEGFTANNLIKELCPLVDGKGGGKPDQAQASLKKLDMIDQCLELVISKIK